MYILYTLYEIQSAAMPRLPEIRIVFYFIYDVSQWFEGTYINMYGNKRVQYIWM